MKEDVGLFILIINIIRSQKTLVSTLPSAELS